MNSVELEEMLRRRLISRVRGLRVSLGSKGFVISGRSNSYYDKQMAQQSAMEMSDLRVADNRIEIIPSGASGATRDRN